MLSDKTYLVLATAVSLVIVATTAMTGLWPLWVGVVIFLPMVFVGLFLKRRTESKQMSEPQPVYQPPPPPQPVPPASTAVQGLVLPSAQRDYRFLLAATVLWRPTGPHGMSHPRPAQLAIDAIRERATRFVERESAADSDLVAPRLAADLSFPLPDRTAHLEVWAQDTTLSIPDDDRQRLDKLAAVRKDEEVWEHERAYERNKRAYLREDVLSSTGSAVVWWLARDVSRVQETVDLIGTLAKLVDAAQDRKVDPVFHTFVNGLTDPSLPATTSDDFMDHLMTRILPNGSEPERADFADRFARFLADDGMTDLARTIRERFNAPDFTEAPTPAHPNGQAEPDSPGTSPGLFDNQL